MPTLAATPVQPSPARDTYVQQLPCLTSAEVDIRVEEDRVLRADAFVIWSGDVAKFDALRFLLPRPHWSQHTLPSAPRLVIGPVSVGHEVHDRQAKRRWYAGFGVRHYWIVDGFRRTLDCLFLAGGEHRDDGPGHDGDVVRPASLEGVAIPLSDVWLGR